MRLFNQSCRVCHTKPQMVSPLYGPELSQNSLGGQESVMREVISNGTPRMPGFKYHFEPTQIEAIVAFLKTIPTPPTPAPASHCALSGWTTGDDLMNSARGFLLAIVVMRQRAFRRPQAPPMPS